MNLQIRRAESTATTGSSGGVEVTRQTRRRTGADDGIARAHGEIQRRGRMVHGRSNRGCALSRGTARRAGGTRAPRSSHEYDHAQWLGGPYRCDHAHDGAVGDVYPGFESVARRRECADHRVARREQESFRTLRRNSRTFRRNICSRTRRGGTRFIPGAAGCGRDSRSSRPIRSNWTAHRDSWWHGDRCEAYSPRRPGVLRPAGQTARQTAQPAEYRDWDMCGEVC